MNKMEAVIAKKKQGYNCAQAVASAYADEVGILEDTLYHLVQGFGAGMGTMDGTCGAISGAIVVLGLLNRDSMQTMKDTRRLMQYFQNRNTSITCKVLKGVETGNVLRPCIDCVKDATEFLEEMRSGM